MRKPLGRGAVAERDLGGRMIIDLRGLVAVVALALATPAHANDSSAELGTGGLDFVYNPKVEMRSEELFISTDQVRVTYRFFNKGDQPVANLVAFPLPDVTIADQDTNIAVPTEEPVNFVQFSTRVDGQPVESQVEQKTIAKGIDRTQMLRDLGLPLAPQLRSTYAALDALPAERWQQLINLGIAEPAEYDTGTGMKQHLEPRWTLKTTFYWQQTFPPQKELVIEHRYKPSVGGTAGTGIGNTQIPDAAGYKLKYCMDAGFAAAVVRAKEVAQRARNAYVMEQRIDYILKTGANWAGPIADFTLTVDKGKPDNLISFCGSGVKKVSPTQFQVRYKDFTPTADLSVLIVTVNTPQ